MGILFVLGGRPGVWMRQASYSDHTPRGGAALPAQICE